MKQESESDCLDIAVDFDQLVQIQIDIAPIDSARDSASAEAKQLELRLNGDREDSLPTQLATLQQQARMIRSELAGPAKKYQEYLNAMREWEVRRESIIGDAESPDTLKFYERELKRCQESKNRIPQLLEQVVTASLTLFDANKELADVYSELYAPVQRFITGHPLAQSEFQMSFETKIDEHGFADNFLQLIAQNKRGSFNGVAEGRQRVEALLQSTDFDDRDSTEAFLREVWRTLHWDLRSDEPQETHVASQVAKGVTVENVYRLLFGLEYLKPVFTLRWAGKDVGLLPIF